GGPGGPGGAPGDWCAGGGGRAGGGGWGGALVAAIRIITARPACCESDKPSAAVSGDRRAGVWAATWNPFRGLPLPGRDPSGCCPLPGSGGELPGSGGDSAPVSRRRRHSVAGVGGTGGCGRLVTAGPRGARACVVPSRPGRCGGV